MSFAQWLERQKRTMNLAAIVRKRPKQFRPQLEALEARLAPVVNLSITNPTPFPEGASGTSDMIFVVTRSGDLAPALTVDYTTQDGTAIAGVDYQARAGTLSFAPNQTTATIAVPIIGNTELQPNRTFTVELSNPIQSSSFTTPQTIVTATNLLYLAMGDFNSDGRTDLAAADRVMNRVGLHLNLTEFGATTPTFAPQQTFATGRLPEAVAAGDLNGDGRPDLVVANATDNTVSVLLNTTAPGASVLEFTPQQTFPTGNRPQFVAMGDLNGDGRPDLAVVNYNGNSVSVLLNTTPTGASTPTFSSHPPFGTSNRPSSLAMADFNGDGRVDVAVASESAGTVRTFVNTTVPGATTPTFFPEQTFSVGPIPFKVVANDLNSDGRPDLIIAIGQSSTVGVRLNTTPPGAMNLSFSALQTFLTGSRPTDVVAGDLNGDRLPDLVVANFFDNNVGVLLNTTQPGSITASFAPRQLYTVVADQGPFRFALGDLNGDNRLDLAVSSFILPNFATLSVLLNTLPPVAVAANFAPREAFPAGSAPNSVAMGDFNGDGKQDLAVVNQTATSTVSVLLNLTTPGATTPSFGSPESFPTGGFAAAVRVGDFNGDGRPDLAVSMAYGVAVLLNTTVPGAVLPNFSPRRTFSTYGASYALAVSDFNGDGRPDLAAVPDDLTFPLSVLLNTTLPGATVPSFSPFQSFDSPSVSSVAVADFNGDGRRDLAASAIEGASSRVSVLLNATAPGATSASFSPPQGFVSGYSSRSVAVADFNGDGKPDLAVASPHAAGGPGAVAVLLNMTAPGATVLSFTARQEFATGIGPRAVEVGDLNGDGRPDLAVANFGTVSSPGNTLSVLLNTMAPGAITPSFSPMQAFTVGDGPRSLALGDLNGDGRPDLAVGNRAGDGTVSVLLNTAAPIALQGSPATGTVQDDDILQVTVFTRSSTGFTAEFSRPLDTTVLNLYDGQGGGLGQPDVTVIDAATMTIVRGTVVIAQDGRSLTFVRTGGPLPQGNYTVTLRSAANGFRAEGGSPLLDGNGDATAGDNYTNTLSVGPFAAVEVSIPDFSRGPGQLVDVPAGTAGLPLRLSASLGVTSVTVTVRYDFRLLRITGGTVASGLPAGAMVNVNTSTNGVAIVTFTSPALGGTITDFVRLTANVPDSAGPFYTQKHLLHLTDLSVNGGALTSLADDAIHVNAYLGDTTGNAGYSATDATRTSRVVVGLDTGFSAYQLADPAIIADITGNGSLSSTDAARILQESIGQDRAEIPPLPTNPPTIMVSGPDPFLNIPRRFRARPGSLVAIPVNLDRSEGLDSANLALSFDPRWLEVVEVRRGSLTSDFDLFAVNVDADAGTIRAGLGRSAGAIVEHGSDCVLRIAFRVRSDAPAGRAIINLRQSIGTTTTQLNEGGLDLQPDPSDEAGDVLDGAITIVPRQQRRESFRTLAARDAVFAELNRRTRDRYGSE